MTSFELFKLLKLKKICILHTFLYFYSPPQKVAGYYVIPSELLSVCPSVVEHSCPVHNFDTVRNNFTKLGTNINHDQTTCRD